MSSFIIRRQRPFFLLRAPRGISERCPDIVRFEVRIKPQDFFGGMPFGQHPQNHPDCHPHPSYTGFATHHFGIGRYTLAPVHKA